MIKKMGRIDAPVHLAKELFSDVAQWPEWMPGVVSAELLEESTDLQRFAMKQVHMGKELDQKMEFRFHAAGVKQRQISGWFKKWEADMRFLEPPDGSGTTLSLEISMELGGFVGLFAPTGMIEKALDDMFREMLGNAEHRLQLKKPARAARGPTAAQAPDAPLLRVYQIPAGLEVWVGERKYLLHAAD